MRTAQTPMTIGRHVMGAVAEALLLAALITALAVTLAPMSGPAHAMANAGSAAAASTKGSIQVAFGTSALAPTTSTSGSIFTSFGCGFRANSSGYYMVVRGPGLDTTSLTYWVDPFPTGSTGCGSSTVSWTSSGVTGNFDVWIVWSPSGNPWQAPAASNTVTITITTL